MSCREKRKPASYIFFAEGKGLAGKEDQGIENGAPRDLIFLERIIEMSNADGVLGKSEAASVWIPDRDCPVANKLREAARSPSLVGRVNARNIGRGCSQHVARLAHEFFPVVQAPIPSNNRA